MTESSATVLDGPPATTADPGTSPRLLAPGAGRAIGLFAAARLTGILAVTVTAWLSGKQPMALLGRSWDSRWYLHIAEHGYGARTLHFRPGVVFSDLAFFPLYPALTRSLYELLPLSAPACALLLAWTATLAAALAIYRIGELLHGRTVAALLVVLWGLLPHSVVLSMAYTEPLLTALGAWSLYAVLKGRWLWAGSLAALAGLARPNGFAVAAAVLATAGYEIVRRRGRVPRGLWAGALLAPVGWSAYVLWVGFRKGDPLGGYFTVQRGWGSRFDFGAGSVRAVQRMLLHGDRFVFPVTLVIVAVAVLLYALLLLERPPLPLLVYSGVLLLVALGGSGYFESKPRFLLPAFPLLLPLACALARTARARPAHALLVVGALAGLSVTYGAYLLAYAHAPL
ncbi:mannosyltransferase family protein [Streptomyces sp. NPDC102406]|uniref:mannosyltransferase family protein n=1 Tax=Streptomyces sp. NPDC102406 TaxID=3366171 RepID=UPI0037F4B2DB